ncbi:MAG: DUF4124 domain-containing protein [Candidatus Binatia bacterium]|nr:DUF4124 domain-containing protein [Candidatus Binatia bacterium]
MTRVLLLTILACAGGVSAQEIYKWEDERGILHYSERPAHPAATPLVKDAVPYSAPAVFPLEALQQNDLSTHQEIETVSVGEEDHGLRPSPRLVGARAVLGANGRVRLSGAIRNGGKGLCESPAVEVVLFDDKGSVDGRFETDAFPAIIGRGQEARFEEEFFPPVGRRVSWDAVPRCGGVEGVVYGGHKSGSLALRQSRTVRLRTSRTR